MYTKSLNFEVVENQKSWSSSCWEWRIRSTLDPFRLCRSCCFGCEYQIALQRMILNRLNLVYYRNSKKWEKTIKVNFLPYWSFKWEKGWVWQEEWMEKLTSRCPMWVNERLSLLSSWQSLTVVGTKTTFEKDFASTFKVLQKQQQTTTSNNFL